MSNIKMLVVDFDRSSVGAALLAAVNEANGRPTNPTYEICSSALAGGADLCAKPEQIRDAVFAGKYWGAVYAAAGVTAQYQATIAGTNTTPYNASSAYVLYGNSTWGVLLFAFYFLFLVSCFLFLVFCFLFVAFQTLAYTLSNRCPLCCLLSGRGAVQPAGYRGGVFCYFHAADIGATVGHSQQQRNGVVGREDPGSAHASWLHVY